MDDRIGRAVVRHVSGWDPVNAEIRQLLPLLFPRAALGEFPTPVERVGDQHDAIWIKRDDLSARPVGGNKVRALELLLAGVRTGDLVVTLGALGSTHALATAVHARRLGARVALVRWPQEMNADAERIERRASTSADACYDAWTPVDALVRSWLLPTRMPGRVHLVPPGGTSPLGIVGHVIGALELATQIERGLLPLPARIVVPLGTGGTAAGLLLGCAIARLETTVVAVRVVPRLVARASRVLALAGRTARLIERRAGQHIPRASRARLEVVHDAFGGAYGRATSAGRDAARWLRETSGIALDTTYSAKAFAVALARRDLSPTLFWLTFDPGRDREA